MKDIGKVKIVLSWDDNNYCCQFKRNGKKEEWNAISRDDQLRAVGAMVTMAEMFQKFIKEEDNG